MAEPSGGRELQQSLVQWYSGTVGTGLQQSLGKSCGSLLHRLTAHRIHFGLHPQVSRFTSCSQGNI